MLWKITERKEILIAFVVFILFSSLVEGSGCCQCIRGCSDAFTDQILCVEHCLKNNDTFINFYENKRCSEYPACDIGACCEQEPNCTQTTRLYCNLYWGGFLKGKACSECLNKTSATNYIGSFGRAYSQIAGLSIFSPFLANERINFYVDNEPRGYLIIKDGKIIDIGEEELRDQTMNVYVSEKTIKEIIDGNMSFVEALRTRKIKYEGVGFISSLKFKVFGFFFNIYSFASELLA